MDVVAQFGTPVYLTASGFVCTKPCSLIGYTVNSTSSGTLQFLDGGASGTAKGGTITPSTGWQVWCGNFQTSAYVVIGGTLDVTFFVVAGVN